MSNPHRGNPTVADVNAQDLKAALTGLEFGSVVVTVHHGRIVQIERREKMRLDKNDRSRLSDHTTNSLTDRSTGGHGTTQGTPSHAQDTENHRRPDRRHPDER